MIFFTRFKNGITIANYSIKYFFAHHLNTLLVCAPLAVLGLVLIQGFIKLYSKVHALLQESQRVQISYLLIFGLLLVCLFFLANIIRTALYHYFIHSLASEKLSFKESLHDTYSKLPTLFQWFLIEILVSALSIGLGVKLSQAGAMFINFLYLIWEVATGFVLAIIATENKPISSMVTQSTGIAARTLIETIIGGFWILLFSALLFLLFFVLLGLPLYLIAYLVYHTANINLLLQFSNFSSIFNLFIFFIGIFAALVTSLISALFLSAIYCYATGRPTNKFPKDLIHSKVLE